VHLCIHRGTKQKCAVKIVDTTKLNLDDSRHMEDEIDILQVKERGRRKGGSGRRREGGREGGE